MKNIIIDCDPGVDDALALLCLTCVSDVSLKLVSVVSGNVSLAQTTTNALYLLERIGLNAPVVMGCDRPLKKEPMYETSVHGMSGLGNILPKTNKTAVEKSLLDAYEKVLNENDDVELVCFAPLTNIASLEISKPGILKRFKRIIIMGGSTSGNGNITNFGEFNFFADPDAVQVVLNSGVDFVLSPIEIGWETEINKSVVVGRDTTDRERLVSDLITGTFDRHGENVFAVHDASAILLLLRPELYNLQRCDIIFESSGKQAGKCSVKLSDTGKYMVQTIASDSETIKQTLIKYFYGEVYE